MQRGRVQRAQKEGGCREGVGGHREPGEVEAEWEASRVLGGEKGMQSEW